MINHLWLNTMATLPFVYFISPKSPQIRIIHRTKVPSSFSLSLSFYMWLQPGNFSWNLFEIFLIFKVHISETGTRRTVRRKKQCLHRRWPVSPAEEAVISVSRLINPRVSCYCTLPAICSSRQNPAGHSSTQYAQPDSPKAVGCLPVERQILHVKVGLKHPWGEFELKGHFTQFAKQQTLGDV